MMNRTSLVSSLALAALLVSVPALADTDQWSGGSVTTNNFSDTTNWVGGTPPSAGDSVRFPAAVPRLSPVDDFAGAGNSFFVIGFQTGGYTLNGTGANTMVVSFITNGTGANTVAASLPIRTGVFGTGLTTQTGTTLTVDGPIDLNGQTLTLNGGLNDLATGTSSDGLGTLNVNGVISGTGAVDARLGIIHINATNTFTGTTGILNGASVFVDGAVGPVNLVNGTLRGVGTTGAVTSTGGSIAPGDSPGILNTGNVSLSSATTLSIEINGATVGTQYDQLNVTGSVVLGNATLALSGTGASIGSVLTIVNNDGADPVSGTFSGLPQGAQITLGSSTFSISYVGGSNTNDVTLTSIDVSGPAPAPIPALSQVAMLLLALCLAALGALTLRRS